MANPSSNSFLITCLWALSWAATCHTHSISSAEDTATTPSSSPSPTPHPYDPLPNLSNNSKLAFIICMAVFGLVFIGFAISDALILRWRRDNGEELVEEWCPDIVPAEAKEEWVEPRGGRLEEWRDRDRGVRDELGGKGKEKAGSSEKEGREKK